MSFPFIFFIFPILISFFFFLLFKCSLFFFLSNLCHFFHLQLLIWCFFRFLCPIFIFLDALFSFFSFVINLLFSPLFQISFFPWIFSLLITTNKYNYIMSYDHGIFLNTSVSVFCFYLSFVLSPSFLQFSSLFLLFFIFSSISVLRLFFLFCIIANLHLCSLFEIFPSDVFFHNIFCN